MSLMPVVTEMVNQVLLVPADVTLSEQPPPTPTWDSLLVSSWIQAMPPPLLALPLPAPIAPELDNNANIFSSVSAELADAQPWAMSKTVTALPVKLQPLPTQCANNAAPI
jgi:hypothetical protein